MRSTLARVAVATTSMVALAFLLPLLFVVRQIAHDRAVADAQHQATAIVAVLSVTTDPDTIGRALVAGGGDTAVHLSGMPPVGTSRARPADVTLAAAQGRSLTADAPGGQVYLQVVALDDGPAVVEVYLPAADLTRGVADAWLALGAVAVVLVAGSLLVADRLGARAVRAARELARAAHDFGRGDHLARVTPAGPPELATVGARFNTMADEVVGLLDAERRLAADLSHRLRTPLTALRLDDLSPTATEAVAALEREIDFIIRTAGRSAAARPAVRVDLAAVVTERLQFWSALAEDEGRSCQVPRLSPCTVALPWDELAAAVDALIGNVLRHTPAGTAFAVACWDHTLVVEDAGPGIADPAYALRRGASGVGSTGLGLDIARHAAESTGGTIAIDSSPLGGARVRLAFGP